MTTIISLERNPIIGKRKVYMRWRFVRFVTIKQVNGMKFMILALRYFTGPPVFFFCFCLVRRTKGATLSTGPSPRYSSPPKRTPQFLWPILFLNKTRNWAGTHLSVPGTGPIDHSSLRSWINQHTLHTKSWYLWIYSSCGSSRISPGKAFVRLQHLVAMSTEHY